MRPGRLHADRLRRPPPLPDRLLRADRAGTEAAELAHQVSTKRPLRAAGACAPAAAASVAAIRRRVSAGSMTSSSSKRVRGVERLRVSSAAAVRSRTRCSRSASSAIASSSLAHRQPDRALEPHRAEVGRRPGDGEQRLVQAAAGHRLGAEPVAAAQDHRDRAAPGAPRRRRGGARRGAPAPVASASGPTIIPGVSTSETIGSPKASQSCMKRAALSDAVAGDRARHAASCCWR